MWNSNTPLWRQLVQPATDYGWGSLSQGGVTGIGGDGQVLICLWGEAMGEQRDTGSWRFPNCAVALRVSRVKSLRQTAESTKKLNFNVAGTTYKFTLYKKELLLQQKMVVPYIFDLIYKCEKML